MTATVYLLRGLRVRVPRSDASKNTAFYSRFRCSALFLTSTWLPTETCGLPRERETKEEVSKKEVYECSQGNEGAIDKYKRREKQTPTVTRTVAPNVLSVRSNSFLSPSLSYVRPFSSTISSPAARMPWRCAGLRLESLSIFLVPVRG